MRRRWWHAGVLGAVALSLIISSGARADAPNVLRLFGATRFGTAAYVSRQLFPDGAPVAYLTNGYRFPDALAGGAATGGRGPVLLTYQDALPSDTVNELLRLHPALIVVLGGEGAVSEAVKQTVENFAPEVVRWYGDDRYATAAAVSAHVFTPPVAVAYIATGEDFPDALAATAAAGVEGGPVLLVERDAVPQPTSDELTRLQPQRIVITGGETKISSAVESALADYTASDVVRVSGPDRYVTAVATVEQAFPEPTTVYVTTGTLFPDALAAGAVAGPRGYPLLLVDPFAIPPVVSCELDRLHPTQIVVIGGPSAMSDAVFYRLMEGYPYSDPGACPSP